MTRLLRTVGHGTASQDELAALLTGAGIGLVVDVRRYAGSRRHPQFGHEAMAAWLPAAGIAYEWLPELGGRRAPDPESPNRGLRNLQFRGYADYMASAEFSAGVARLLALAERRPAAVLCAETVWWRCHRRLLADHLVLVSGWRVEHLFHDGRLVEHPITGGARRHGAVVHYEPVT